MRHIKVFVSSTKAHELMSIINGVTRQMMIPLRMFDTGTGYSEWDSHTQTNDSKIWIKFEVCDDSLSWDVLKDRIDRLNNHGKYAEGPSKWVMPCEIEVYDDEAED